MKKRILSVLMTLCMVLTLLPVSALAAETPDFTIKPEAGIACGYKILGDQSVELVSAEFTNYWYNLTIPETVENEGETYTVVSIASDAFTGKNWARTIVLPDTITEIKAHTFEDMTGLSSINLPDTITSIGESAFEGCSLSKVTELPESLTSLGERAFYETKITNIEIPAGIKEIPAYAFAGCEYLESVTFNEGLMTIGESAFTGSGVGAPSLKFPASLRSIEKDAFRWSDFTSVVFQDGIQNIHGGAFYGCTNMRGDLVLPESLTGLGYQAFYDCPFDNITFYNKASIIDLPWSATEGQVFTQSNNSYSDTVTVLKANGSNYDGCYQRWGPFNTVKLVIDEGIDTISTSVFYNCNIDRELVLPSTLEHVYDTAFTGTNGPDTITIPDNAGDLGGLAFSYNNRPPIYLNDVFLSNYPSVGSSGPFPNYSVVYVASQTMLDYYKDSLWAENYHYDFRLIELDKVAPPQAATGLVYNGTEQTGVLSGTGYTLSGTTMATNAGTYTVYAVPQTGYQWTDGTTSTKTITWTIAKAPRQFTIEELSGLYVGQTANFVFNDNAEEDTPTYTYESSNPAVAKVENGVVTLVGAGNATITVTAPATTNYEAATGTVTVNVSALPKQTVTFDQEGDQDAVYGDAVIENKATSAQGGTVTYISTNPNVATVDEDGTVTIVGAGETTIQATAAAVEGYAPTTASYKLTVAPKEITATASVADKTFDGTNEATVTNVAFEGVVGDDVDDYTATAAFTDPNVGTGKTVTVTITIDDPNYTLSNGTITLNNGVITQAEAPTIPDRTFSVHFSDTAEKTFDLSDLMPANAGTTTFTRGEVADNNGNVLSVYEVQEDTFVYQLSEGLTEENAGTTVTVPVTITSQNYKEATAKLMISITDKWTPEVSAEDITVTYTGNPVPDSAIKGTATVNGILVEGAWSFAEGQTPVNVKDSGNKTVVFTPTDLNVYTTAQDTVLVTINKADPDGEPSYTAITGSGHTLADAALNKGTIAIPGAIVWDDGDDTVVEANTAYGWTFTPEDTDNYKILTGTITPYVRSSGGGSGSGSSSTTRYSVTVKNSDNGDVEANVSRAAKGDTVTLTVTPDEGYVLDTLTVTAANGDKINLNRGSNGRYTFEMPASRVTVEATFVEEGGEEAAEPFVDVSAGDWFYDAVVYVYDNGLMSGTAATTFGPNVGTTRGMIATILWRLAGSPNGGVNPFADVSSSDYYAEAVAWAAGEGIVGGYGNGVFGANDPITREQMALMMYRYAQYAGYETSQRSSTLTGYADYASISDWAVEAVSWANAVGLMNGRTASTIVPTGTITRAEAATILMQFGENVQK